MQPEKAQVSLCISAVLLDSIFLFRHTKYGSGWRIWLSSKQFILPLSHYACTFYPFVPSIHKLGLANSVEQHEMLQMQHPMWVNTVCYHKTHIQQLKYYGRFDKQPLIKDNIPFQYIDNNNAYQYLN